MNQHYHDLDVQHDPSDINKKAELLSTDLLMWRWDVNEVRAKRQCHTDAYDPKKRGW